VKELLRPGHVLSHHPRIKDENLKFEVQTLKASNNTLPINLHLTFMFFSQILDSETVKRKKGEKKESDEKKNSLRGKEPLESSKCITKTI
jgi:hypothetical protein